MDITIAIPTYNGAERLPLMLERLRSQTGTESIAWEILVVDNNSTDDTAAVVQKYQADWPYPYPLKYSFEPEQGAAFARQRAVQEAQGEMIGFLDDDNLPAADWVAAAVAFAQTHPQAGAYGSRIHGEYETEPFDGFQRVAPFLAITQLGSQPYRYQPTQKMALPAGAGVVVRRHAWLEAVPRRCSLKGRLGQSPVGGEDLEPLLYLHKAGWEIWYNPEMQTYHQIPSSRLQREYLMAIAWGAGLNSCHLRMIICPAWQKPGLWLKILLGSSRKLITQLFKHWQLQPHDPIAACEMAFLWGYLFSPFYFLSLLLRPNIAPPGSR